jgi:hypothetical protein
VRWQARILIGQSLFPLSHLEWDHSNGFSCGLRCGFGLGLEWVGGIDICRKKVEFLYRGFCLCLPGVRIAMIVSVIFRYTVQYKSEVDMLGAVLHN